MTNEEFVEKAMGLLFSDGESHSKEEILEGIEKLKTESELYRSGAIIQFGVSDPLFAEYISSNMCASYVGDNDDFSLYEVEYILDNMSDEDRDKFPESKTQKFINAGYVEV